MKFFRGSKIKIVRVVLLVCFIFIAVAGLFPDYLGAQENQGETDFWGQVGRKILINQARALPAGFKLVTQMGLEAVIGRDTPGECFSFTNFSASACVQVFFSAISLLLNLILGFLVYIAATFLFHSINFSVLIFRQFVESVGAIDEGWRLFRNFANIFFIFIMLYIAIGTILRLPTVKTREMIIRLIIYALLINFSLVITKTIIDSGNILGTYFYEQATLLTKGKGIEYTLINATQIHNLTGLAQNIPSFLGEEARRVIVDSQPITLLETIVTGFMSAIFLAFLAFVLFAAAIFFVGRAVILLFLMITAPVAFLFGILPVAPAVAKRWWNTLINQTFFAPAFLAILAVVMLLLNGMERIRFFFSTTEGIPSWMPQLLSYLMLIGMLIAALVIAKNMGAWGGARALSLAEKWGKGLGRRAYGTAMTNTFGRMAGYAAEGLRRTGVAQSRLGRAFGGGLAIKTLDAAASASFGVRESKGGYYKAVEKRAEREKKFAESLEKSPLTGERLRPEAELRPRRAYLESRQPRTRLGAFFSLPSTRRATRAIREDLGKAEAEERRKRRAGEKREGLEADLERARDELEKLRAGETGADDRVAAWLGIPAAQRGTEEKRLREKIEGIEDQLSVLADAELLREMRSEIGKVRTEQEKAGERPAPPTGEGGGEKK